MATQEFSLANAEAFVGRELGVSAWVTMDQQRIDQFAECTEDHVDPYRYRASET